MAVISDAQILSETVAGCIVFGILASSTFWSIRELFSAWRAGSVQSKLGLVHRSSDARTFRWLVGLQVACVILFGIGLLAVTTGLAERIFDVRDLRLGTTVFVAVLLLLTALAARFSR